MAAKKSKAKEEKTEVPEVENFDTLEIVEVELEQGSESWLAWRRRYRMASESPAIMGVSPYAKAADVRKAKLSGAGQFQNAAMKQGSEQEPIARAAYEQTLGEPVRPCVLQRGEYAASLDGLSFDRRIDLEVKVPWQGRDSERWQLAEQNKATLSDEIQIQHQLMVSGASIGHLWVYDVKTREGLLVCVLPDPELQAKIRAAWDIFWPTMNERDDLEWIEAAKEWKRAKWASLEAEADLASAEERVKKLAVGKFTCGGGISATRGSRIGNTDWKRVRADLLPNVSDKVIDGYRGKPSETFSVKEVK